MHKFGRALSIVYSVIALLIFSYKCVLAYQLKFSIDIFDSSLRLVSGMYASSGFKPYDTFAFVYPPGLVLFQQLFHLNYVQKYHAFLFLFLLIVAALSRLIFKKTHSIVLAATIALVSIFNINLTGDPFVEILWVSLIICMYFFITTKEQKFGTWVSIIGIVLFFLRWDRVVLPFFLLIGSGAFCWFIWKKTDLLKLAGKLGASMLGGVGLLLLYLKLCAVNISNALYFIFLVPFKILPYRKLSLEPFTLSPALFLHKKYVVYVGIVVCLLILGYAMKHITKTRKHISEYLVLLIMLIPVLSYAMGRADWPHALPLLFTLTIVLILLTQRDKRFYIVLSIFLLYQAGLFDVVKLRLFFIENYRSKQAFAEMDSGLSSCRLAVEKLKYATIFVARLKYESYVYSDAMLYLIDPYKKPATRYISDEPNLQNTCYDGTKIAEDLSNAEKPMLVFIDQFPQQKEQNLSATMKSCGVVEHWLETKPAVSVGSCTQLDKKFIIRLYE